MGSRAHWFHEAGYFAVEVDEDGPDNLTKRYVVDITEAKEEFTDADAIRVYRQGRWGDRFYGTYVRKGDRLVKI